MYKLRAGSVVAAAILAAFGWSAVAADQAPASGTQAQTEYWNMDHSPADAKAMRLMSSQKARATEPSGKVEYQTMDHSPADIKAMQRMGAPKPTTQPGAYSTMDHSRGDVKAMRNMKGPEKVVTVGE